jgi:hypothetical protein
LKGLRVNGSEVRRSGACYYVAIAGDIRPGSIRMEVRTGKSWRAAVWVSDSKQQTIYNLRASPRAASKRARAIAVGKTADLAAWSADNLVELPYHIPHGHEPARVRLSLIMQANAGANTRHAAAAGGTTKGLVVGGSGPDRLESEAGGANIRRKTKRRVGRRHSRGWLGGGGVGV